MTNMSSRNKGVEIPFFNNRFYPFTSVHYCTFEKLDIEVQYRKDRRVLSNSLSHYQISQSDNLTD